LLGESLPLGKVETHVEDYDGKYFKMRRKKGEGSGEGVL